MKLSFQLTLFMSSFLTAIILLLADELRDDVIENISERERHNEYESQTSPSESLDLKSDAYISSSTLGTLDDGSIETLQSPESFSSSGNHTSLEWVDNSESFESSDVRDNSESETNIDRPMSDVTDELLNNITTKSDVNSSRGEEIISNSESDSLQTLENIADPEKVNIAAEDDEMDSQKTRIFVDYASKHSGANIIDKSKDFQGTSNLLIDDDDRYAISPCDIGNGGVKYVIIALSEDILVKTIKLLSYERYSSQTKQFQVLGSQTYPISTKWVDLGTFTAKPWYNTDGKQTFELEQGVWARYLKFRFLTHYGNEHYCTVTRIMVHGSTTLQDFHEERWSSAEELDDETDENTIINPDSGEKNESLDILIESKERVPINGILSDSPDIMVDDGTTRNHEETAILSETIAPVLFSSSAPVNTAVSSDVPTTKRSDVDSRYSIDFYHNIILMSSNSFQSLYDAAGKDQCVDGTANLAISSKSRAYETAFRNVGNFSVRLEETTASILATTSPRNKSKVLEAVNSAVMSMVKLSPISDALEGIQRLLHVDLLPNSMTPKKRRTHHTIMSTDDATMDIIEDEQVALDSDQIESENLNTTRTNVDEKTSLSPIELKYLARERIVRSQVIDCLGRLNIQELKTKLTKTGLKGGSTANEPIFKKLADEIKSLQLNQGVYDHFIRSATNCYQSVITEMMNDMLTFELDMEQRIIRIEQSLSTTNIVHDQWAWLPKSLWSFLLETFLECTNYFQSLHENTKVRRWRWAKTSEIDALHLKALNGFKFDLVSFLVGFFAAVFIMFMFGRRKNDVKYIGNYS